MWRRMRHPQEDLQDNRRYCIFPCMHVGKKYFQCMWASAFTSMNSSPRCTNSVDVDINPTSLGNWNEGCQVEDHFWKGWLLIIYGIIVFHILSSMSWSWSRKGFPRDNEPFPLKCLVLEVEDKTTISQFIDACTPPLLSSGKRFFYRFHTIFRAKLILTNWLAHVLEGNRTLFPSSVLCMHLLDRPLPPSFTPVPS